MEDNKIPFPIYHGNETLRKISFIVNVAWGNEYLIELLNFLKERNISLTFFLQGWWVEQYPEYALMIKNSNQEIGNHSYSHRDMRTLSVEEIHMEITQTNKIINEVLGVTPKYFTPPSGYIDTKVLEIAARLKMVTVLWSLDTLDWKIKNANEIIDKIVPNIKNGSIILMHPTESSLKALPYMVEKALEKNYHIENISKMLNNM
ncbi:polysaccharide deacetylase family protein [Neobacillus ginsengisoli]|uniref:Sporulation protein (Polysaccharide deacetylase family) n=1 Tax=Neobacillus ginsengisoli TaxID=904295 RepID=A0ABT9XZI7_9BACI|nr:polysaccharide deacetylase family protein [Neobacillus ginsengisoli]MDQ0200989.1 putative sporulation protein (polysaccharide deacetylase family) [Neobacillus ginsengisoli]